MRAKRRYSFSCQFDRAAALGCCLAVDQRIRSSALIWRRWVLLRHMGEVVETQPTIGSNVEEVVHNNVHFNVVSSERRAARAG